MKDVYLERFAYTHMGTFGVIKVDEFEWFTVERPWLNNKARESCIPEGAYRISLGMYNRGGYPAYEIQSVPDRSLIKIHVANTENDVVGCIGLGLALGWVDNKWAVTQSKKALNQFMRQMQGDEGKIIIHRQEIEAWG